MAFSDYQSALTTLRTHLTNEAWQSARKQLAICRAWLAEEEKQGTFEGASYTLASDELDKIGEALDALAATSVSPQNRVGITRMNYVSR